MKLPRNNKRGVTLVEVVIGVFVLSIFALGILSLLIYNNQAVSDSAIKKTDTSAAVQKLDTIIAAVSYGDDSGFVTYTGEGKDKKATGLDDEKLAQLIGVDKTDLRIAEDRYDKTNPSSLIRGWYITLTYKVPRGDETVETVVKGYAANTKGAFDGKDGE